MFRFPIALVRDRIPFEIDPSVISPDSQVVTRDGVLDRIVSFGKGKGFQATWTHSPLTL